MGHLLFLVEGLIIEHVESLSFRNAESKYSPDMASLLRCGADKPGAKPS